MTTDQTTLMTERGFIEITAIYRQLYELIYKLCSHAPHVFEPEIITKYRDEIESLTANKPNVDSVKVDKLVVQITNAAEFTAFYEGRAKRIAASTLLVKYLPDEYCDDLADERGLPILNNLFGDYYRLYTRDSIALFNIDVDGHPMDQSMAPNTSGYLEFMEMLIAKRDALADVIYDKGFDEAIEYTYYVGDLVPDEGEERDHDEKIVDILLDSLGNAIGALQVTAMIMANPEEEDAAKGFISYEDDEDDLDDVCIECRKAEAEKEEARQEGVT